MVLPVRVKALGLAAGQSRFFYRVESYSEDLPADLDGKREQVDQTARQAYDMLRPGVTVQADGNVPPTWEDWTETRLAVTLYAPDYVSSGAQGILLLHHHNGGGWQSEVIPIYSDWAWEIFFPFVGTATE